MKLGICSDHAGFEYKQKLSDYLRKKGYDVLDYGTYGVESVDYADFGHKLGFAVENGEVESGIAICGSGEGMVMTLNHHLGIRAGLAWNCEIGKLIKEHNNANVLVLPERFISLTMAKRITVRWLNASFEGGRHIARIAKIPIK